MKAPLDLDYVTNKEHFVSSSDGHNERAAYNRPFSVSAEARQSLGRRRTDTLYLPCSEMSRQRSDDLGGLEGFAYKEKLKGKLRKNLLTFLAKSIEVECESRALPHALAFEACNTRSAVALQLTRCYGKKWQTDASRRYEK
ncbi:hypothetical protein EVAR_59810_1 [Eumeta japonica]|uniref:Uncharacterized protein n=1 Tax=Eumeta variegata TaxID=151549 RepID=A0A4C1YBZ7_EUMVA|nr:hypothetical protein EVAR_59810_1 [Eumeta japonica]